MGRIEADDEFVPRLLDIECGLSRVGEVEADAGAGEPRPGRGVEPPRSNESRGIAGAGLFGIRSRQTVAVAGAAEGEGGDEGEALGTRGVQGRRGHGPLGPSQAGRRAPGPGTGRTGNGDAS